MFGIERKETKRGGLIYVVIQKQTKPSRHGEIGVEFSDAEPEAVHKEAMGDHGPVRGPRVQIRITLGRGVPPQLPRHRQGEAHHPQLPPGDRLRHQVLHPRPAPQPPSHTTHRLEEARRREAHEGTDLRRLRLSARLSQFRR